MRSIGFNAGRKIRDHENPGPKIRKSGTDLFPLAELMASRDVAGNRRVPNTAEFNKGLFMASLEAHYSARDIETRILAALRVAGLNPEQRLSPVKLGRSTISSKPGSEPNIRDRFI